MKLPRFDRTTAFVVLGAVLVALLYAGLVNYARSYYEERSPSASVFNSKPQGTSIWYQYLKGLGLKPQTWQTWETLPARATIITVAPYVNPPSRAEAQRTSDWVAAGGRLVLVGSGAGALVPAQLASAGASSGSTSPLAPRLPSAYALGVRTIAPGADRLLPTGDAWVATYGDLAGRALISQKFGRGEIVWLAGPNPVDNTGIGQRDDGRLATLLAISPGRAIYFDEYHHGYVDEASVWDRMSAGGRWAVILAVIGVAVLLVARGRRIAPMIAVPEEPAARTGAYIGSLAELYRKAGARSEVLETYEEGLKRALVRRHGTLEIAYARNPQAHDALDASAALRARGDVARDEFVAYARQLSRARREVEGT